MPIAIADIMEVLWGREGEISGTYWWNRVGIISTIIWAGQISVDLASSLSMRSSLLLPAASSIIPTEIADIIGEGCWGRGAEISGESDGIERLDHGNELGSRLVLILSDARCLSMSRRSSDCHCNRMLSGKYQHGMYSATISHLIRIIESNFR